MHLKYCVKTFLDKNNPQYTLQDLQQLNTFNEVPQLLLQASQQNCFIDVDILLESLHRPWLIKEDQVIREMSLKELCDHLAPESTALVKAPHHQNFFPWLQIDVLVYTLQKTYADLPIHHINGQARLHYLFPPLQLPNIQYLSPLRLKKDQNEYTWGGNFTRLDTNNIWDRLTITSRQSILKEDLVRIALTELNAVMSSSSYRIPHLFKMSRKDAQHSTTTMPELSDRVQYYYPAMTKKTRWHRRYATLIKERQGISEIPQEDTVKNLHLWVDTDIKELGIYRTWVRKWSQKHNVSIWWMAYAVQVALRMVEGLLCQGYVISLPNFGRLWMVQVNLESIKELGIEYRVQFEDAKYFGAPWKKPR